MRYQKITVLALVVGLLTSSLASAGSIGIHPHHHHFGPAHAMHQPHRWHHPPRHFHHQKWHHRHHHYRNGAILTMAVGGAALWAATHSAPSRTVIKQETIYLPSNSSSSTVSSGVYYTDLPNGSDAVLINGTQYFTHNGKFYLPIERNGRIVYQEVFL